MARNHRASQMWWLFERLLRKHPDYPKTKNQWAIEDSGKGSKERLFEKLFPIFFMIGFAVFMLVLEH